jgi:hypothetical protein
MVAFETKTPEAIGRMLSGLLQNRDSATASNVSDRGRPDSGVGESGPPQSASYSRFGAAPKRWEARCCFSILIGVCGRASR